MNLLGWQKINFDGTLSKFDESFLGRLRDKPEWHLHVKHALYNFMIPNTHLEAELRQRSEHAAKAGSNGGGMLELPTLTGETIQVWYDDIREELQIDNEDVFMSDVKGIDGYMHLYSVCTALFNEVCIIYMCCLSMQLFKTKRVSKFSLPC